MTKLYKLTNADLTTRDNTKWGENITHEIAADKRRPDLCTAGVLHAYETIELALLLNPLHADIQAPVLWEAEGNIVVSEWDKCGCYTLTTTKKIPLPKWWELRTQVAVMFAALCAEAVLYLYENYDSNNRAPRQAINFAIDFALTGNAADAADTVYAAADAADAAYAATRATYAAHAAAHAAARAAHTAYAAASAARAAARAARAAARAAADAADAAARAACAADVNLNFQKIAKEAIERVLLNE